MTCESGMRCVVTGGGTGGHVFSSLAIAHALSPTCSVLFIGARGRMETREAEKAGFPFVGVWISGLQRKLSLRGLLLPLQLLVSLCHACWVLWQFKPAVVVGTGGYASFPALCAALLQGVPIVLHEQNSMPGRVTAYLARWAKKICVAYKSLFQRFPSFPVVLTGNPVRQEITAVFGETATPTSVREKETHALRRFGLTAATRPVVLVLGGSLGSYTFNRTLLDHLPKLKEKRWRVIWQVGKRDFSWVARGLSRCEGHGLCVLSFIDAMEEAYLAADVIVSRAGALTLSELCVVGKPVVLVPSPHVARDHQCENARYFAQREAVCLLEDGAVYTQLIPTLQHLLTDMAWQRRLSENIRALAIPRAEQRFSQEVFALCNG